jgi:hypothetical protein
MIEADPVKQNVFLARENPPRFAPEGSSSSSRGRSQDAPRDVMRLATFGRREQFLGGLPLALPLPARLGVDAPT